MLWTSSLVVEMRKILFIPEKRLRATLARKCNQTLSVNTHEKIIFEDLRSFWFESSAFVFLPPSSKIREPFENRTSFEWCVFSPQVWYFKRLDLPSHLADHVLSTYPSNERADRFEVKKRNLFLAVIHFFLKWLVEFSVKSGRWVYLMPLHLCQEILLVNRFLKGLRGR